MYDGLKINIKGRLPQQARLAQATASWQTKVMGKS